MKILVFSPYYPPHIGGLESYSDELNKYLSFSGMDIVVFTPQLPKNSPTVEEKYASVKIVRFPAFEIISNYPLPKFWSFRFWKTFFSLFENKFDFVVSHTRFFSTSLLALIYSKLKKTFWIHIEHGSDFVQLNNGLSSSLAKLYDLSFGKLVLRKSDRNIAISEAVKKFVQHLSERKECDVLYRGFETEKLEKIPPSSEFQKKPDEIYILFVGRLIDGKGLPDLLEAFSHLSEPKIRLLLVGDGPQKENLLQQAENLNIAEKVSFLGYRKYSDTISILKLADIFVNPSYTEGLPTTVIEAALCKKAIVATNVGGTDEIIENGRSGYLVQPKDIETLGKKIDELIKSKSLRDKFGQAAFEDNVNKFNWEKSIQQINNILNETK
ncbi:MAG: glycosyltransferase family 4 protein [Parcubacteria group bacterium]|jgi:glycosyltransferase involved in cell wall biosynthesis